MLTPREAFKVSFLSRCIESGHTTPDEIYNVVKQAFDKKAFVPQLLKEYGPTALALSFAAPLGIGALGGKALSVATDVNDVDIDSLKKQEIIDELKRQTERLKRKSRLHGAYGQQSKKPSKIYFGG